MNKNERINAKTALKKNQMKHRNGSGRTGSFVPEGEAGAGLKKAMVILPILIIVILIAMLIVGLNQFRSFFNSYQPAAETESSQRNVVPMDDKKLLMVVSPEEPLPSNYKVDLADVEQIQVDRGIEEDLEEMLRSAEEEHISLELTGGYVSAEEQHDLYEAEVSKLMAEESLSRTNASEKAEKTVPAQNHSERQSGLAVTFGKTGAAVFSDSEEYRWMLRNASRFGFILRYPEGKEKSTGFAFDPTQFRYVGKDNAGKMKTLNMSLEEYVSYLNSRQ